MKLLATRTHIPERPLGKREPPYGFPWLRAPVSEVKIVDFQNIVNLNLYGPPLTMQAVIPHMRAQGGRSILNVSSKVSKMAIPTIGAYAATKYALNGLTRTARSGLADEGIVVTVMYPNYETRR